MDEITNSDSTTSLHVFFGRQFFTDCSEKGREFELSIYELPSHSFSGFANEVTQRDDGDYIFRSFAEGSLTHCVTLARYRILVFQSISFSIINGFFDLASNFRRHAMTVPTVVRKAAPRQHTMKSHLGGPCGFVLASAPALPV